MKRAKQGSGRSPKHPGNARSKAHLPRPFFRWYWLGIITAIFLLLFFHCGRKVNEFTSLADLEGGSLFAVPTGTVADQFVLQRFPDARLVYFNSVYDCALAVKQGKADAAVYDMPVLKNIAGKNPGLTVIDEVMVPDNYGFAVELENTELKGAIDATLSDMKSTGLYDEMLKRWLPEQGLPGPMPDFENNKAEEKLLFATAAVTEPMSYIDSNHQIIGFDIEFAQRIANRLNRKLEILNMEFGAMLPALISGKVDMIGAGLSITEERAKSVLFSESYYKGGLVALVRQPANPEPSALSAGEKPDEYKTLGVLTGSIHEGFAHKQYPGSKVLSYNAISDMLAGLNGGKVDGVFVDHSAVKRILFQNSSFELLDSNIFVVDIGAGFNKGSKELREQFNLFLKEIKGNGTYDQMLDRWIDHAGTIMPDIETKNTSGVLRIGVVSDIGLPNVAKNNDQWLGFDVELSARFAAWLGKTPEWVDMPFGSLLSSLGSGKIDIITSSMMITEERSKQIDFSDPYFASGASILGKKRAGDAIPGGKGIASFWQKFSSSFYNNLILEKRYMMILRGLWVTILISVFAALLGTILGGLVCAMRMSKNKAWINTAKIFIALIRGTPVLVLLMIIYYVVFASVDINAVLVAVIAFGINFAAYVSEMFRTSIESIDRGQREAGIATGFTRVQTFIFIIMPQAVRRVLPVYKGEFISLLKMTSVVGYIAVEDLTKASDIIRSRTFDAFFPLIMAAVIYIVLAWLLTAGLSRIEFNLDPQRKLKRVFIRKEGVK